MKFQQPAVDMQDLYLRELVSCSQEGMASQLQPFRKHSSLVYKLVSSPSMPVVLV